MVHFRFEWRQVVGFLKGRRRQEVPWIGSFWNEIDLWGRVRRLGTENRPKIGSEGTRQDLLDFMSISNPPPNVLKTIKRVGSYIVELRKGPEASQKHLAR